MVSSVMISPSGSSPLARGLRFDHEGKPCAVRIIPARAGFTGVSRVIAWRTPDHPRSRGVYVKGLTDQMSAEGSSPLARGLPRKENIMRCCARIIPARAGFTSTTRRPSSRGSDHPRSRGVYPDRRFVGRVGEGSSPLARGLPHPVLLPVLVVRIIPARAGFTTT